MKGFAHIIDEVATETGIPFAIIMGRSRRLEVMAARDEAMHRIYYELLDATYRRIGGYFGRDHTGIGRTIRRQSERLGMGAAR